MDKRSIILQDCKRITWKIHKALRKVPGLQTYTHITNLFYYCEYYASPFLRMIRTWVLSSSSFEYYLKIRLEIKVVRHPVFSNGEGREALLSSNNWLTYKMELRKPTSQDFCELKFIYVKAQYISCNQQWWLNKCTDSTFLHQLTSRWHSCATLESLRGLWTQKCHGFIYIDFLFAWQMLSGKGGPNKQ